MKKKFSTAFTLVEVLISVVLLGLIFSYIFSTINSLKRQNTPYVLKSKKLQKQEEIFMLIDRDFAQALSVPAITTTQHYDVVSMRSNNSLYGIAQPYILYFVSKKEEALVRVESLKVFDFSPKTDISQVVMYADTLAKHVKSFKVGKTSYGLYILLRAKGLDPMMQSIPTLSTQGKK